MEAELKELREKLKWYQDYERVVYTNKPNVDQYACEYADRQQEQRQS